jgi:hypothetical protein
MIDLVAGRIDVMFLNIGSAKAQIESGTLRGLAVSGTTRAPTLPNVPTFHEVGVPLPELDPGTWWGVAAPAGLPADMTQKLNTAMRDALTDPDLREKLAKLNVDPTPGLCRRIPGADQARDQEMGRRDQARQDHRGLAGGAKYERIDSTTANSEEMPCRTPNCAA